MAQIFHRSTNTLARVTIFGALLLAGGSLYLLNVINRSHYVSGVRVAREQPVQFSHKHHAGELGIDCRYCHGQVEVAAYAGIPPTATCINCHAQIWADSAFLEPVRASLRDNRPLRWIKVHDLPDFVYFNHAAHVLKGIGCASCHGRVDQMNQIWKEATLYMEWCLACHRNPEQYIRPREEVFNMSWQPPGGDQRTLGRELVKAYNVHPRTDCSTCHR